MSTTVVKERPIIFSSPMVRAILDGRKTQTRRVYGKTLKCQYGVPGDRLWVREKLRPNGKGCTVVYEADGLPVMVDGESADWRWNVNSIAPRYMPRWASRITLEITDVRVQRLQEISESDAIAEGIDGTDYLSPVAGFIDLWHAIHKNDGPHGWEENPWVWAISFVVLNS